MEVTSCLDLFPVEILLHISEYLPTEDIINFSMTCKWMYKVMPKFKVEEKKITGPDINEQQNPEDPHYCPRHYFDTPCFESSEEWKFQRVQKLEASMIWNDQVYLVYYIKTFLSIFRNIALHMCIS